MIIFASILSLFKFTTIEFDDYLAPAGRLIFGPNTEERQSHALEQQLRDWGFKPSGYCEKSHQEYEELARKMFWFDKV